jgi:O-antigen/teichoic acid export membrane protein
VAYWALAARIFAPEEVGVAAVLLSTLLLLSSLTQLNARVALMRFIPEAGRHSMRFAGLWYMSIGAFGLVGGVILLATLGVWTAIAPSLGTLSGQYLGYWFVASIVIWSFFNVQDGLLIGLGKATVVPFENGIYAVTKLGLLAILAGWTGHAAIFVSWTLPAAVAVVAISILAFGRLIPAHATRTQTRTLPSTPKLVRFLALDYAAYVMAIAGATLLPAVVVAFSGTAQGAYFYIPWVILTSLMLVPIYLSTSLTVQAANNRAAVAEHLRPVLVHTMRLLVPTVVGTALLAAPILAVFGRRYAEEGTDLLRVASIGLIPYAINVLYLAVARIRGRGHVIVVAQASLTVLTLGLSVLLLPTTGIVGVGIAWAAANGAVAAVLLPLGLLPMLAEHAYSGIDQRSGAAEKPHQPEPEAPS